jgi:signal transduction histidine kinase
MRPLDRVRSIKVKLSLVIVAAVGISAVVSSIGLRAGIPVWLRPFIAAAIALLLVYPFARGITSPLRDMAAASRAVAEGDYTAPVRSTSRDEVGELARAFDAMRTQLAAVDQQRRDLIANVSHELRTPLAGLRARFENIADGVELADPDNVRSTLAEIERLSRLVDELLDLSRIESGTSPLEVDELDLTELLHHAVRDARLRQPDLIVEVRAAEGITYCGDEARVLQVVRNLLDNAARHSPEHEPVELSARRSSSGIELTVSDRGPGIPVEERGRVFERFYRSDHARAADGGGSGLGLSIARGIVELHHGSIEIASNQPTGSRFVVSLPDPQEGAP